MADRIPAYPMVPNFNAGLIQQQQQQQQLNHQQAQQHQQQQQQQQQPHQQEHPNLPGFPDQGRMWQQIQHMQQFRGGDMNNPQVNSQMMDLLRSQTLARVQGQQQQQQQLNQQQFALQQMANGGNPRSGGASQQPQSFHDPSANQQPQPHMNGGFPTMNGGGVPGTAPLQSLNSRNAAMMAFQASQGTQAPHLSRQLDLMLAQNQPQNGIAFPNRLEQQQRQHQAQQQQAQQQQQHLQAMNQSSPGDMFSSPGMAAADRRPSPAHPNLQTSNPMGGQQPQQPQSQPGQRRAPITLSEMTDRAAALRSHIASQEQALLNYNPPPGADPAAVAKVRLELKAKKEYLGKLVIMIQNQNVAGANNMNAIHAAAAQQQQAGGSGQGSWQGGPPQSFENSPNQMARTPMQPQGQNNPQPSPGHHHAQVQGNHLLTQPIVPPRSGPTPHQIQHPGAGGNGGVPGGGASFPNQMSPHMGQQFPYPNNGGNAAAPAGPPQVPTLSMQLPPPLEKARFDNAYKSFVQNRNIKHEMRLMNVEGRQIDLYALHTHVMQEGGYNKVQQNDLWPNIGGKMGFISFPGTDTEPAKAGPGTAQRLAMVYKDYLGAFDMVYINSVFESRKKLQAAQAVHSGVGIISQQPGLQQGGRGALTPQQMQLVIGYANQSVAELRAQNVQDRIIQFVEANRAHLQRTRMEQGMFRDRFQMHNQAARGPQEQHGVPNGVPGFSGSPPQPNAGLNPQQQFMQRHNAMMQGNNFIDNRPQPQQPQLQQPQQQPGGFQFPVGRPSKEQLAGAMAFILKTKAEFQKISLPNMRHPDIPNEQRPEFNALIEQLHHYAQEMDGKLSMYYFVLNSEDAIKKLIAIVMTVMHQRNLLSVTGSPRFIVSLENLRGMMQQVQKSNNMFNAYLQTMMNRSQQQGNMAPNGHQGHPSLDMARSSLPQHQMQPQPQSLLPNRPPVNLRPPPVMKKPSISAQLPPQASTSAAVSTPTPPPAYSALTPVANTPTPTHTASSPQAPKSPKVKASAKPKAPPKRRPSVKNAPAPAPPPAEQQPQTPASSSSGPGNASGSGSGSNTKRQRDEEPSIASTLGASPLGSVANEPSPPKRIKTESEWEGPPNEALKKKNEAAENVKTEEDASAFLEQMTELIKRAAGGEGQESLTSDISETLDQILKGYSDTPDGMLSSLGESSRMHVSSPPPTNLPIQDEFFEFIDFSSFATVEDDDDGSKAPTPDLSSSSTNPSPGSGSEADAAHHALLSSTEVKTEDRPDPLRLGTWKDIDGGESAYYQSSDWKWDSPMATQEWAIFPS